jgi:alkylation response protein AidB-like acyl-CoA dehydrogenase
VKLRHALDTAQQVAHDVLGPRAEEVDREGRWPEQGIRALQRAGLGGLVAPAAAGGAGLGLGALARVCEVLGAACGSTSLCFGMHCVGTAVLAAKATPEQTARYLVPIARGEHLTTLALSEPGTGAHFYLPNTELSAAPDGGFRVRGAKSFVTSGGHADSYVLSTRPADPGAPPGQFSCVLVRADTPGVRWRGEWEGWGMRGNSSLVMELEDAPVPRGDLLGQQGDEIWYVFHVVAPYFLMAMAGTYLGVAARALEEGRQHLLERVYAHSGQPLASENVLQHRLGTLWAQVERTRALVHAAADKGDAGAPDALPALCSAKAEVAECAERVASEVMTLMGGRAYGQRSTIQRLYREARAAHVMAPTTDMLRTWTGRALLGLPLLGE